MRSAMKKLDASIIAALLFATAIAATIFVINTMTVQPVYAPPTGCAACAKDFAPGQEAEDPVGAEDLTPGKLAPHCIGCAEDLAPGQLKQKEVIPP
jgi:hypothetical protein